MNAPARIKMNPPLGQLPVLQYCAPDQLKIDEGYQRGLDTERSQSLIRRIAAHWDWGLCQPLFVARREGGGLFVVDGQHRLAAAKLRGDIWQLPCVVSHFATPADEAASFVALNQQRRPLSRIDLFKAAVAAGETDAVMVARIIEESGLKLSNHANTTLMKPGHICNIGGILGCLQAQGADVTGLALKVLAASYPDQVLRYSGSIFPGIVAIVENQIGARAVLNQIVDEVAAFVGARPQGRWVKAFAVAISEDTNLKRSKAARLVMLGAWRDRHKVAVVASGPAPAPTDLLPAERAWCDQCDQMVSGARAADCASPFCKLKRQAA